MIPKDPVMLLSYVNTQLRDFYRSLDAFCEDRGLNRKELEDKLDMIDYLYKKIRNRKKYPFRIKKRSGYFFVEK